MQREPDPRAKKVIWGAVAVFILLMCMVAVHERNGAGGPGHSEPNSAAAYVMAQEFVERRLRSPGTADFPWSPTSTTKLGWGHFRVSAYVDSQNAFGATLRTDWTAEVKTKDGDKWTLVDLSMNPR